MYCIENNIRNSSKLSKNVSAMNADFYIGINKLKVIFNETLKNIFLGE